MNDEYNDLLKAQSFMLMKNSLVNNRSDWYSMLSSWFDNEVFLREYAYPARQTCLSIYDMHRYLLYYGAQRQKDSYASVYAFRRYKKLSPDNVSKRKNCPDYSTAYIDKIFFDLDASKEKGTTVNDAFKDAMIIKNVFKEYCDVIFTGNRGFHVYINISGTIGSIQLKAIQLTIAQSLKLRTADECCFGDTARVLRIPYTVHTKTGRLVLPVFKDDTLLSIIDVSNSPRENKCIKVRPLIRKSTEMSILLLMLEANKYDCISQSIQSDNIDIYKRYSINRL